MKKLLCLIALLVTSALVFAGPKQPKATTAVLTEDEIFARLDKYVEEVAEDWNLKGIVVMIGDDKTVLHQKCLGYRDPEAQEPIPMDEHTVFQIASVSKSFTTALVASLVDEGKIKWDDKVIDILPDFEFADSWVTKNATIEDFCCHRSGLKDFNGSSGARLGYSKKEMLHLMKYIKPAFSFRSGYNYCNMAFVIPALVVEKVTGKSWQANVRERIYTPLGMSESMFRGETYAAAFADRRASQPYKLEAKKGEISVTRYPDEQVAAATPAASEAAGGIISTPLDLTRWAQFHLRKGTVGTGKQTRQVISKEQMEFLHTPVNIMQTDDRSIWGYGMAWITEQWDKCKIVHHTGTNNGQIAICAFIPELNRTFTINSNTELPTPARRALLYRYIDLMLGYEEYDYNADALAQWHKENPAPKNTKVKKDAAPDYRLLIGTYTKNQDWGDIVVSMKDDKLYLKMVKTGREWVLTHESGNDFTFNTCGSLFVVHFNFTDKTSRRAMGLEFTRRFLPEFGGWKRQL